MLNIEKYKDEILENWSKSAKLEDAVAMVYMKVTNQGNNYFLQEGIVGWLCEEYQEPVLDDAERKYLSAVIKPFRNRIVSIAKIKDWIDENSNLEVVEIVLKLPNKYQDLEYVQLPYFEKDTMYKNMKANKRYTLEELGL